jgi:hypothetical protein
MRCSECGQEYEYDTCPQCGGPGDVPAGPGLGLRPLRGLGDLLTGLLALTIGVSVVQLALRLHGAGRPPWTPTLGANLDTASGLIFIATVIAFVSWLYRARANAEHSTWPQRRARGWAIWGWVVPVANFFVPFQLVGDIWRAGLPASQRGKTAWLPALWWTTWLISETTTQSQQTAPPSPPSSSDGSGFSFHPGHWSASPTYGLCAAAISAALLIAIIRRVNTGPVGSPPSE